MHRGRTGGLDRVQGGRGKCLGGDEKIGGGGGRAAPEVLRDFWRFWWFDAPVTHCLKNRRGPQGQGGRGLLTFPHMVIHTLSRLVNSEVGASPIRYAGRMRAFSQILDEALALSAAAHSGQRRKGSDIPYIMHPVHVGIVLLKHGFPEAVVLAGLLHDVVEDTDVSLAQIADRFGAEVARLVDGVTERKSETEGGPTRPWRTRKEEQLAHLRGADPACAALKAADALHNCESLLADLERHGAGVWRRFRAPRDEQLWYYQSIATLCRERLGPHPLCDELDAAIARLART